MVEKDLIKVYACAGALWSSFKMPNSDIELKLFDKVWFSVLKDYDIKIVLLALREFAKTNDFCNIAKVGELCNKMTEIANGTYVEENAVLEEIRKAISYDYCRENFEKLSPFAKKIVGQPAQLAKWERSPDPMEMILANLRKRIQSEIEIQTLKKSLSSANLLEVGDEQKYLTD